MRSKIAAAIVLAAVTVAPAPLTLQAQLSPQTAELSPETAQQIAAIATKTLQSSGVPSASIGIVENGRIVYTHAFGLARVEPPLPASASMAYPIGSISKQFTASAVLILQQQGKLSLNDPVSKFFPELTRSNEVRILNLLTHTSGYQDYAPQDYTIPAWKLPTDPLKVVREFAGKPLDFTPGTQWQYSNTNFVLAALIVQKVSGEPFAQFLREHVLAPAHIEDVLNLNTDKSELQVRGYMRNALAPIRPAVLEASGWYFGDGDLAMPVASLLTWDLTLINQSLLSPASYKAMETPFILKNGTDSHYGLGMDVLTRDGRRILEHSGEVGGFVAENVVFPDDHAAIAVLTNQEASEAASEIAKAIMPLVVPAAASQPAEAADAFAPQLQTILTGLQQGKIDRSLFTPDCNDYFDRDALADFQSSLAPLGTITSVVRTRTNLRGGMTFSLYKVSFSGGTTVLVTIYLEPDGKIEQLLVVGKA
ncbi:MAG TPA: serine hydrolase domain-containing protein [Acidobacteriaceae bacterium]|jgi:CubicO group peptidase (beta-lactamase class C family)|nr:serine hydrolase domain-containing protein [Acidobacteriaceae bacterium]